MKDFAPVVPLSIARYLRAHNVLGTYHLLLAHDVLANPEEYKEIYADYADGRKMEIIMDNSLIELGVPMDIEDVIKAAKVVGASKVVFPDVLGDFDATIKLVDGAMDAWELLPSEDTKDLTPICVVQGKDMDECIQCLKHYAALGVAISVPRVLQSILGTRSELVAIANMHFGFEDIHLLGFSDNILDDIACTRMSGVRGLDSAVPIRAGIRGYHMSLDSRDLSHAIGPRGDYWETNVASLSPHQRLNMTSNIARVQEWINR